MGFRVLVTGGAGFIGSHLVNTIAKKSKYSDIIILDKLNYASNLENIQSIHIKNRMVKIDLAKSEEDIFNVLKALNPNIIFHLAAESHVDNSIENPDPFFESNIKGTYNLVKAALAFQRLGVTPDFKFIHVSTDEVYGELTREEPPFTENHPYKPNSPYSASKAASDHLVRAAHHTHGLQAIITHCSNNYGPFQHKEKLIPTIIDKCLRNMDIPIYGTGENIRDWIYVKDHVEALIKVAEQGEVGEVYNIGADEEFSNICIAEDIISTIKKKYPTINSKIKLVTDRLGHDFRYAIDSSKIRNLGWQPSVSLEEGLRLTLDWYERN